MVVALLLALTGTVISGLMVYGAEEKAGLLGGWYADGATVIRPIASARADDGDEADHGEGHEEAETLEELHEFFANVTLFLVGLHVAGVAVTSLRERQNLARAMVTGRKRAPAPEEPA
jgi:cytochrome b